MGKTKWIAGTAMLFFCLTAVAQDQRTQPQQNNKAQEQTAPNPSDNSQKQRAGTADTPGAQEAAADANNGTGQDTAGQGSATRNAASNTPVVPQTTSSPSGSPAMLSEEANGRDGTNNVQRATMNMAGSPAENLNMDNVQTGDVNKELKDRQDYTQGKQNSANQAGGVQGNTGGDKAEINDKTRRENDAQSDQTLSAKENKVSGKNGGKEKSEKKSKRKKNRG